SDPTQDPRKHATRHRYREVIFKAFLKRSLLNPKSSRIVYGFRSLTGRVTGSTSQRRRPAGRCEPWSERAVHAAANHRARTARPDRLHIRATNPSWSALG